MIKLFYKNLILFLLLYCSLWSCAQNQFDWGSWNTFSFSKPLNSKLSLGIDEELRLRENFSQLNLFYTNLGLTYKVAKDVKLSLTYRFIQKYLEQEFSYRNRLMLDMGVKHKINLLTLSYRSRLQAEVKNYFTSENGHLKEWFWRHKFEAKYSIKKFNPYIGTELRYQLNDPRSPENNAGWHRMRTFAGVDYEINKTNSVGIYYLNQFEFGVVNPNKIHVIGLEYSIDLP